MLTMTSLTFTARAFSRTVLLLLLFFCGWLRPALSQNLILNGDCEMPVISDSIPYWTQVSGFQWEQLVSSADYAYAYSGSYFFGAGNTASAELSQDVNVSSYAATIDAGSQQFTLQGYEQSYNQSPPDSGKIIVEYRDASNTSVLASFNSGNKGSINTWQLISNTQVAPVGTRTIRVRLIATRFNGSYNDGYFDDISLTPAGALPVELSRFTSQLTDQGIRLNWQTATEKNNSGFEIDRSTDKLTFSKIGFVKGNGTTTESQSYSFLDAQASGKVFYRLRQIDFDGHATYSPTIEANAGSPKTFALQQNYPNPFNPSTTISFSLPTAALVRLTIYDMLGREVATLVKGWRDAGKYDVSFDASHLATGLYLYRLQAADVTVTKRMMLVK